MPPGPDDLDALLLGAPRRYTREEVAELAGVPVERGRKYWRALGFADTGGAVAFTDLDVAALRRILRMVDEGVMTESLAIGMVRAIGHTTARLASWQVDLALDELSSGTGIREQVGMPAAYEAAEQFLPELEPLMIHAWRLHLAAAVRRVLQGDDETLVDAVHLTVGFADLVGFTRLSQRLEERELAGVVERFEQVGSDLVTAAGARLVKTLGDEVLFVAERPAQAVGAALDLLDGFLGDETIPELRIGLATGLVIYRMGDVFGTTVNLASRLTSLARPGTVVVDRGTAADIADEPAFAVAALWPRPVRGLGVVEPFVVTRRPQAVSRPG